MLRFLGGMMIVGVVHAALGVALYWGLVKGPLPAAG